MVSPKGLENSDLQFFEILVGMLFDQTFLFTFVLPNGPILESKAMHAKFQKKGNKKVKRAKYLKIWAKMYKV